MHTQHPIVGIDIGKDSIFVGFLPEAPEAAAPKNWRSVVQVSYQDPLWWHTLLDLIDETAIVAAEPTGHHLLAPVANLLHAYRPSAQVWQVEGKQTERYRESYVAAAKNDRLDAIALTLIARDIAAGQPPRSCRPYDHFLESAVQRLRMLVNTHRRLTKENTRTKNRLHVLAHSLWPAFAGSSTWARAVYHGAVTPTQVKALAAQQPPPSDYADGRVRRFLVTLAKSLPDIDADPAVAAAIVDLVQHQRLTDVQLAAITDQIVSLIESPYFARITRRWRTVPNASDIAIAALHVATDGRATELDRNEFCAAVGTAPRTNTSGGIDKTRASKKGYSPVRATLHLWALGLVSPSAAPTTIRDYSQQGKAFAAARNKLARVLWGVARSPEGYKYTPPSQPAAADEAGEFPPAT